MGISKEIFGIEKLKITNEENTWVRGYEDGFNKCIDNIDQFEPSEEVIYKILSDVHFRWKEDIKNNIKIKEENIMIREAKAIIKNKSKIFVRKNK